MKLMTAVLMSGAVLAFASPACADEGQNIYVSPSGADTNPGTAELPVATLAKGLKLAHGGETVHVASGDYVETRDAQARTQLVRVVGEGPTKPKVAGLRLGGAQELSFENFEITEQ